MYSGRLPVSRSSVSTVLRQISTRAPCATRLDQLAVGIFRTQQIDARTERYDLDRDLVRVVEFHEVVGDADHKTLFLRVVVGELQHDLVFGKRLVLQWRLLGADIRRGCRYQQCRDRDASEGGETCHPCSTMPGLFSTPYSVTSGGDRLGGLPDLRCLATTSHIGAPACSLTEAQ